MTPNVFKLIRLAAIALLLFSSTCHGQTNQPTKQEDGKSRDIIFGLTLGVSTSSDIEAMADIKDADQCKRKIESACGFHFSREYGYITKDGKTVSFDRSDSITRIESADFVIAGEYFSGRFIDGVLFELKVKTSEYNDEFYDAEFISELRARYNRNYKRLPSVKTSVRGGDMNWIYVYDNWSAPSGAFNVYIQDSRKFVVNEFACLSNARRLSVAGGTTAEMQINCRKNTDNIPKFNVVYYHSKLNADAFGIVNAAIDKRKADEVDSKQKKLNKF